jgi:UDP-glucuronate 4-epimerase
MKTKKTILVTGAAGFIGFHLAKALIKQGYTVVGLDNINAYYDVNLKYARLNELGIDRAEAEVFNKLCISASHGVKMKFIRMNLEDRNALPKLFKELKFDMVCNLAAQPGVRYSLENPEAYIDSNINGFLNILECCRHHNVKRLVYASSSSIYGNSATVPFHESANVDKPISLYAATKKSNELMAHTYAHLYGIETIGLRFFTVYGPWGRPDMAMFLFTDAIINNRPIKVFNKGKLSRDFTYIDDIVSGVVNTLLVDAKDSALYKLYNIGNSAPVQLMDFIHAIESKLGVEAQKQMLPMQPGDVNQTWADVRALQNDYNYTPNTTVEEGVAAFVEWYQSNYKTNEGQQVS